MNTNQIERDSDGFLLDPEDWDRDIAQVIADEYQLTLTKAHWQEIEIIRFCFEQSGIVPKLRTILKHLKLELGKDTATRKYIYSLFPYGYGQQGCKIAGMRKPLKLWLDL